MEVDRGQAVQAYSLVHTPAKTRVVSLLQTVWTGPGTHPAFVPWTPSRSAQIFPNSRIPFKILAAGNVTCGKGRPGAPHIRRHRGDRNVLLAVSRYSAEVKNEWSYTPRPHTLSYYSEACLRILVNAGNKSVDSH